MLQKLAALDQRISETMHRVSDPALRFSFAVIFIWFGALKPLGHSAATPLVLATIDWMPLLTANQWLHVIGWWEVLIGVTFLFRRTTRLAIALLFGQMAGTFMPLVLLPEVSFQDGNLALPTMEGQYIIKNLMILSAALVAGGRLRRS